MAAFFIRRAAFAVAALFGATLVLFILSRAAGDPRYLYLSEDNIGGAVSFDERWEAMGKDFGLDQPLPIQFLKYMGRVVRGDWGDSLRSGKPAFAVVKQKIPATLQLSAATIVVVLITSIPLGILSAVWRGSIADYTARTVAALGQAAPHFWLGIILMLVFSVSLGWLPTSQRGGWQHYVLPVATLGWHSWSGLMRLTRSAMLSVMDSEYVKLARAKGLPERRVIWKHSFRNALIAPLTASALITAGYLTGTVVTETVFAWPGLGAVTIEAVKQNDFPVMSAAVTMFVVMYLIITLALDITYVLIDPRIRLR